MYEAAYTYSFGYSFQAEEELSSLFTLFMSVFHTYIFPPFSVRYFSQITYMFYPFPLLLSLSRH